MHAWEGSPCPSSATHRPAAVRSARKRVAQQALKSGLTLPACKRPADIDKADDGEFFSYHRVLGHTIEDCWVFKDLIEEGYKDGTIQLLKSFQQDPAPHNSNDKAKGSPTQFRILPYQASPEL
jgi:hypothetical protein